MIFGRAFPPINCRQGLALASGANPGCALPHRGGRQGLPAKRARDCSVSGERQGLPAKRGRDCSVSGERQGLPAKRGRDCSVSGERLQPTAAKGSASSRT
jgi:hypothetical protein